MQEIVKGTMIKKGTMVMLKKGSRYYDEQGHHGVGTVIEGSSSPWLIVKFPDDYVNAYERGDLVIVHPRSYLGCVRKKS